jgi:hypothetical protein
MKGCIRDANDSGGDATKRIGVTGLRERDAARVPRLRGAGDEASAPEDARYTARSFF